MPQLDATTWLSQIFWTAIALFILYKVLTKTILPRISDSLEDRHNAIAEDLDKAAELKNQAENAEAAYKQAMADARANAQKIAAETQAEIDAELATASAEADAEIAARTSESEARISEVRAQAAGNAKEIASEAAAAIIEKFAPGLADSKAITAAVEKALGASK
ncbi:UNVERIFIED_CONTAM: hypothetical protein GTU68_015286 [Idotea baltica]|nr:hypothetical protein [Idotea baltica]